DQTLANLDKAAGGHNATIETEMATRLADGAAAADQTAGIKAGTVSALTASQTLENEAKQVGVGSVVALASLEVALGGNSTVEQTMGQLIGQGASAAAAIAAIEASAKVGTVDQTL